MKPFNLKRALAGDPVVTRGGKPVKQLTFFDVKRDAYSVVGILGEVVVSWTVDGHRYQGDITEYDLFMAPREVWVIVEENSQSGRMYINPNVAYTLDEAREMLSVRCYSSDRKKYDKIYIRSITLED